MIRISSRMIAPLGVIAISLLTMIAAPAQDASLPKWTADAASLSKLGPAKNFEGYTLRVPRGYVKTHVVHEPLGQNKFSMYGFTGPDESSYATPNVMVFTITGMASSSSVDEETLFKNLNGQLKLCIDLVTRSSHDLVKDHVEYGFVNGLLMARQKFHFSAGDKTKHYNGHGVFYVTWTGTSSIDVGSFDLEPYDRKSLPVAQACAFTVQKK